MNAKDIINRMTADDVVAILEDLGSRPPRITGADMLFTTVCHRHNGGRKHKLHYHADTKSFFCYSECGHLSNIFNVVMSAKQCDFKEAYKYICDFLKIGNNILKYGFEEEKIDNSFINRFEIDKENAEHIQIRDKSVLNRFRELYHHSWIKDHISINVMKLFDIRFDVLNNAIIIPHYNINNELIGIRARNLSEEKIELGMKYIPITINGVLYNYPTSINLYGLNINKENIKKYKRVTIGESEKFVMQHRSYYEDSTAVALSGSSISEYQMRMLLDLGVETVVIALDKEFENGEQEKDYVNKVNRSFVLKLMRYFQVEIIWDRESLLEYKSSPTDYGVAIYEKLYEKRIII